MMDIFCDSCDLKGKCPADQRQLVKMIVEPLEIDGKEGYIPTPEEVRTDYLVEDLRTAKKVVECVIKRIRGECERV